MPKSLDAGPMASRDFRWLLAGRGIDSLGNAMYPIALGFAVLSLFDSLTALGVIVGAASLGMATFLLAGGIVADRLPRTLVIVVSNLVAAAMQVGVIVLVATDTPVLWVFVGLSFLTGAAAAFDGPATTALVPQILAAGQLHRANAAMMFTRRATGVAGAVVAGLVVAWTSPATALAINAGTFLFAGLCFSRIHAAPLAATASVTSPWQDLVEGWHEFRARTWVWVVVVAFMVANAIWVGGFHLLGLAIADETMGPAAWGFILAAEGAGAAIGAWTAGRREPRRPMRTGMIMTTLSLAPIPALALGFNAWLVGFSAFLAGVAIMQFGVAWDTSLQRHIPPQKLARVSAFDGLGSVAAIPLGSFLAGPLADLWGTTSVLWGAFGLGLIACLGALASKDVRNLT